MDAADRRGRRASWIAAALVVLVVVAVRMGLGDRLARERYLTLREHEFRRNRFEIARILDTVVPGQPCPIVVWEIEGVALDELLESEEWTSRPHVVSVDADEGGRSTAVALVEALMATAAADSEVSVTTTSWRCDLVSARPIEPGKQVPTFVDGVHDDVPDISPYRTEGDASWVALETIRALERPPVEHRLVWARHVEPTRPHLSHAKFGGDARASELSATAFYAQRVREYLRRRGCPLGRLLLVTETPRQMEIAVFDEVASATSYSLSGFVTHVIGEGG